MNFSAHAIVMVHGRVILYYSTAVVDGIEPLFVASRPAPLFTLYIICIEDRGSLTNNVL